MKIRNGFVSNSSSSSFVIGVKGDLTEEKLLKLFKIKKGTPLYPIAKQLAEIIVSSSERIELKDYMEDMCIEKETDLPNTVKKIVKNKFTFYSGNACDDGDSAIESLLCAIDLNYEDKDIIIDKDGGY